MNSEEIETFSPPSQLSWRQWLKKNHTSKQSVWLLLYKKQSGKPTITWSVAVDEALCFGWVDSKRKPIDEEKFIQFFSKRKSKGTWSKINKEKVLRLVEEGLMTKAGHECIEAAKQNGSWKILDEVEELKIPADLKKAFKTKKGSIDFFLSLSKSVRKTILLWLVLAKREETRQKRINEIVERASLKLKPKHL
ncbi:MAG: YdeI/OmpD-associated family protein [Ferruginibacter sp.]